MIRVIDDFVNPAYYKAIENCILTNFVWGFSSNISGGTASSFRSFGFSHNLFDAGNPVSQFYGFLSPMFIQAQEETAAKVLVRARSDMTVVSGEQVTYPPHIDMPQHKDHINMIFYVGDSDGDTIIYKEKYFPQELAVDSQQAKTEQVHSTDIVPKTLTVEQRVTPKANRLVIFNGEHWHTGQSPKDHSRRVILNLNFVYND